MLTPPLFTSFLPSPLPLPFPFSPSPLPLSLPPPFSSFLPLLPSSYPLLPLPRSPLLLRLRDLSAQEKLEHQRVVRDLERNTAEANHLREQREKLEQDLQVHTQ